MTRTSKRSFIGLFLGLGVLLGLSSLAWACTPLADIRLEVVTAPSGTEVETTGRGFEPSAGPREAPVEIRWENHLGALLATAEGPEFEVDVAIPEAPPGIYYIVAVQGSQVRARAEFEVKPAGRDISGAPGSEATTSGGSSSLTTKGGPGHEPRSAQGAVTGSARDRVPEVEESSSAAGTTPIDVISPFRFALAERSLAFARHPYPGVGSSVARPAEENASSFSEAAAPIFPASSPFSDLIRGVFLLSAGLSALAAGGFVAVVRRRRARS
ncbi:MAG: hypothetical protein ACR2L3_04650 [Actinomycetota bacterium]